MASIGVKSKQTLPVFPLNLQFDRDDNDDGGDEDKNVAHGKYSNTTTALPLDAIWLVTDHHIDPNYIQLGKNDYFYKVYYC